MARSTQVVEFGPYRLDLSVRLLTRQGVVVPLAPKSLDILSVLVLNAGEVITKEALLQAVWPDTFVEEGNLTQHVWLLRKSLGTRPDGGEYVETFPKRGYRFAAATSAGESSLADIALLKSGPALPSIAQPAAPRQSRVAGFLPSGGKVWFLALLALLGAVLLYVFLGRQPAPLNSVAVLPFENLSGDPSQEIVADGFTESLIGELARFPQIKVISRTSVMRLRDTKLSVPAIGKELNVDAVVEGSITEAEGRLYIRVQLIRAQNDEHLFSEYYVRELQHLPSLQYEVAVSVAKAMSAAISPDPADESRSQRSANPAAMAEFYRGRYHWNRRTPESIRTAIRHFSASIAADPAYAPAYAGLADCYNQQGTVVIGERPPQEARSLAIAAARKAIEIDGRLAGAYAALAYSDLYNWNWEKAEAGFRRAIQLEPGYSPAHLWYAHLLTAQRRNQEALQQATSALELDPLSPIMRTQMGWLTRMMGQDQEAVTHLKRALELDPEYLWAHWELSGIYQKQGRKAEALEMAQHAVEISGRSPTMLCHLGNMLARQGDERGARMVLQELRDTARKRYVSPYLFLTLHLSLGELDQVWGYLEQLVAERSNSLAYYHVNHTWEPIRNTPRGQLLAREIGLAR